MEEKKVAINLATASLVKADNPAPGGHIGQKDEDTVEVESGDVVRLVLQFLKEHNLQRAFQSLQEESGVYLSTLQSRERFVQEVSGGKLELLLETAGEANLPQGLLFDVYEHVALEIVELAGPQMLTEFMESTTVFKVLKDQEPLRVNRLRNLSQRTTKIEKEEIWGDKSRLKRRKQIAKEVADQMTVAPPSRLMALLQLAVKAQRSQGLIAPGVKYDLFRGLTTLDRQMCVTPATSIRHTIALPSKKRRVFVAVFSPDGHSLVTGDSSGEILVWSWMSGKLRTDLQYQSEEFYMFHAADDGKSIAITALAYAEDGKLASGDAEGNLKMWDPNTGRKLVGPIKIHTASITSLHFHPTEPQLLTGSNDGTARIVFPVSGTASKTFEGHEGFVVGAFFDGPKATSVVTGSSDGCMRVFNVKSGRETHKIIPPHRGSNIVPLQSIIRDKRSPNQYFLCVKARAVHCMDSAGSSLRDFKSDDKGHYWAITTSPNGEFLVGQDEFGNLEVFDTENGECVSVSKGITNGPGGVSYHPHQNVMAAWGSDNKLLILEG